MKTSQDGSAFVVADAHVARAWLTGRCTFQVVRGRGIPIGGAGHIHNRSLVQFFDGHSLFASPSVGIDCTSLDGFRQYSSTLLNICALRSPQCWSNNDAGGATCCSSRLLAARSFRTGGHSTTLRAADGERKRRRLAVSKIPA